MFREAAAALEIRLRHLTRRETEAAVRLRAVVVQPEGREGFFVNGQQGWINPVFESLRRGA